MIEARDIERLDDNAARALAAYGQQATLSSRAKADVRARIATSIARRSARPRQHTRAPVDVAASAWRIGVALAAVAGVLLAVRLVGSGVHAMRASSPDAHTAAHASVTDDNPGDASQRERTRPGASGPPQPSPSTTEARAAPDPQRDPRSPANSSEPTTKTTPKAIPAKRPPGLEASATVPADGSPPIDTTLAAEMTLMRAARAALRVGDPSKALRHLGRHRTDYEHGQMVEDREALVVQALCDARRAQEARAAARAFVQAHPGSLHAARVEKICRDS